MTEAGWTRERPSKEGWYWFRNNENCESVVQVYQHVDEGWFLSGPEIEHCTFDEIEHDEDDEPTDCEWLGPITPDSYQQGRVAVNVDALVDRFLAWPLPASVCSDLCATKQGDPHRSGTNLLSAVEAKAMIEHVLGIAQQAHGEKGVGE